MRLITDEYIGYRNDAFLAAQAIDGQTTHLASWHVAFIDQPRACEVHADGLFAVNARPPPAALAGRPAALGKVAGQGAAVQVAESSGEAAVLCVAAACAGRRHQLAVPGLRRFSREFAGCGLPFVSGLL